VAATALAWVVLPITYLLTEPADNINWVFGPGSKPQTWMRPVLYLLLLMLTLPLCVYLPTHRVLLKPVSRSSYCVSRARSSIGTPASACDTGQLSFASSA
jgi:hypothetical protein